MDQLKHTHLVLMFGVSLLIPIFLAYSPYTDLSGTVLLCLDMSFEDPNEGDLSTCKNEFKVFVVGLSSNPLLPWMPFDRGFSPFSYPLTSHNQITSLVRCQANHPPLGLILPHALYRYTV